MADIPENIGITTPQLAMPTEQRVGALLVPLSEVEQQTNTASVSGNIVYLNRPGVQSGVAGYNPSTPSMGGTVVTPPEGGGRQESMPETYSKDTLDEKFAHLETKMSGQVAQLDSKMDLLLEKVTSKVDGISKEIKAVDDRVADLRTHMDSSLTLAFGRTTNWITITGIIVSAVVAIVVGLGVYLGSKLPSGPSQPPITVNVQQPAQPGAHPATTHKGP